MALGNPFRSLQSMITQALGYGIGGAMQAAIEPEVQDVVNEAWRLHPVRPLSPADAASAVVRGALDRDRARAEASSSGIDSERFDIIELLSGEPPGPETLLDLLRRGAIDEDRVREGVRQGRIRTEWLDAILELRRNLLGAADLASMVVQGVKPQDEARRLAGQVGIDGDDFDAMVLLAGGPPGAETLLDLWNRGVIDETAVDRGLKQSHLKPEWVDAVKELRHVLPSVSDLIRFAVREVYTPDTRRRFGMDEDFPEAFAREGARRGLDEQTARDYWAAHWELPSPSQGYTMLHRRIIDQADLELLLRSLDVMPFWRDKLLKINYLVPGRIDLRRMYAARVITETEVYDGYRDLGYDDTNARRLTNFAKAGTTEKEHDLVKGEILALYEGRELTADEAAKALGGLGYDSNEVAMLLSLAEARRYRKFVESALSRLHTLFVTHKISRDETVPAIDALAISPQARDDLLKVWDDERAANLPVLTKSEITRAAKKGILTAQAAAAELALLGYDSQQVALLLGLVDVRL